MLYLISLGCHPVWTLRSLIRQRPPHHVYAIDLLPGTSPPKEPLSSLPAPDMQVMKDYVDSSLAAVKDESVRRRCPRDAPRMDNYTLVLSSHTSYPLLKKMMMCGTDENVNLCLWYYCISHNNCTQFANLNKMQKYQGPNSGRLLIFIQ